MRKLPHVGLNLPDADERSMPEQKGLRWTTPTEKAQQREALIEYLMDPLSMNREMRGGREPIRVAAEVGEPIREIEEA